MSLCQTPPKLVVCPGLLDDGDDIGVFGDGLGQGVAADRPEARREGDLLGRGQFLIAEKQH